MEQASHPMSVYRLLIESSRPYFAEIPYALWGEVNYDSEGNCKRPTDREWTWLKVTNRETEQRVMITSSQRAFQITSHDSEIAARVACYLLERCSAGIIGDDPRAHVGRWSYLEAYARTARVRAEFPSPELAPLDSNMFWGSWKWVGWYASDFTRVGRWIMNSLLVKDTRAVYLCIAWLKEPPFYPDQSSALRHALKVLTGKEYDTDQEWIRWYEGSLFRAAGRQLYPKPDFEEWLIDLKND